MICIICIICIIRITRFIYIEDGRGKFFFIDILIYRYFIQMLTKRVKFEEIFYDIDQLKQVLHEII